MNNNSAKIQDRYLAAVCNDEYDVPTGQILSYFAEIPGDRDHVLGSRLSFRRPRQSATIQDDQSLLFTCQKQ
jgi:hypothetical protein